MKKLHFFGLLLCVLTAASALAVNGNMGGGNGSESTPYLIEDLADFDTFADPNNAATYWAAGVHTKLTTNIDLSGRTYTTAVIATSTLPFSGSFNGNNNTISNCTIDTAGTSVDYLGLFGKLSNSQIINLGLNSFNIEVGDYSEYVGVLCGQNSFGLISNCYSNGSVEGGYRSYHLGGLCGKNSYGTILNCYTTGLVISAYNSQYLGGLCGENSSGSAINCYTTSSVMGKNGSSNVGGLCGRNYHGNVINCYFYLLGGPDNSQGLPLDELQMQDVASFYGFDFVDNSDDGTEDVWVIESGRCPKLAWQNDNGPLPPSGPITTLLGSGHSDNPFQINNNADFLEFRTNNSLNCGYYALNTDIDLASETFTVAVINRAFGGHVDGNNHVISNITINPPIGGDNAFNIGFFSCIYASVSNLGIENINISEGYFTCIGGLCGKNIFGIISNCFVTGSITTGRSFDIGGLCGYGENGTITNCYTSCLIQGGNESESLGGLCGTNIFGTIQNCFATSSVEGSYGSYYIGGLCGTNSLGTIVNCYALGSVAAGANSSSIGGLCGKSSGTLENSYATGSVTGDGYLGGFCGQKSSGNIIACFWDTQTSGTIDGVGNQNPDPVGVSGRNTVHMQTQNTFTDAGWDFVSEATNGTDSIWRMCVDGVDYPRLWWEFTPADFVCDDGVDLVDFAYLASYWGTDCDNPACGRADIDGSGDVGLADLVYVSEDWLKE